MTDRSIGELIYDENDIKLLEEVLELIKRDDCYYAEKRHIDGMKELIKRMKT